MLGRSVYQSICVQKKAGWASLRKRRYGGRGQQDLFLLVGGMKNRQCVERLTDGALSHTLDSQKLESVQQPTKHTVQY